MGLREASRFSRSSACPTALHHEPQLASTCSGKWPDLRPESRFPARTDRLPLPGSPSTHSTIMHPSSRDLWERLGYGPGSPFTGSTRVDETAVSPDYLYNGDFDTLQSRQKGFLNFLFPRSELLAVGKGEGWLR